MENFFKRLHKIELRKERSGKDLRARWRRKSKKTARDNEKEVGKKLETRCLGVAESKK